MWVIPNVKCNHVEKTTHPCQFPVELIERFVLSMTKKGDWVFDPFEFHKLVVFNQPLVAHGIGGTDEKFYRQLDIVMNNIFGLKGTWSFMI